MSCHYPERRLIGEILVDRGLITPEQLEEALATQNAAGSAEYIGEILVRLGHAEDSEIVIALVLQCNLPFIAVSKHDVDGEIIKLIPAEMALHHRIVPLDRIGNILSVVMQNPLDDELRERMEQMTGCRIAVFISTKAEIERALAKFYPAPRKPCP